MPDVARPRPLLRLLVQRGVTGLTREFGSCGRSFPTCGNELDRAVLVCLVGYGRSDKVLQMIVGYVEASELQNRRMTEQWNSRTAECFRCQSLAVRRLLSGGCCQAVA